MTSKKMMLRDSVRTLLYFPNFTTKMALSVGKRAETTTRRISSVLLPYLFGIPLSPK
ncbi:MAG: hypothetical protein QG670_114 [Thermoproteota archaeon]|nr:hypothetical protein [Thermoproteota archaeon]